MKDALRLCESLVEVLRDDEDDAVRALAERVDAQANVLRARLDINDPGYSQSA